MFSSKRDLSWTNHRSRIESKWTVLSAVVVPRLRRRRNTTLRLFDGIANRSGGMSPLRFHRVTDAADAAGNDLSFIGAGSGFDV